MAAHALTLDFAVLTRASKPLREASRTMDVVLGEPPEVDDSAFREVYARTARPLRAYLGRVLGNAALADDLLQETYYRFLRAGFSSNDEAYERRYLFRIATNLMRDHFRRPRLEVGQEVEAEPEAGFGPEMELRADVGGALAQLKPRDRAMLWLAYVEGATHEEIAGVLGLKSRSVRSMLFRARSRIADVLRSGGFASDKRGKT